MPLAAIRIGICVVGISTPTQSHVISIHYKSSEWFQGRSASQFGYIDALKINYFSETNFSQTLIITCFLLIHRMFASESNVYHKLLILQEPGNQG